MITAEPRERRGQFYLNQAGSGQEGLHIEVTPSRDPSWERR
jgi:hypothetical protein